MVPSATPEARAISDTFELKKPFREKIFTAARRIRSRLSPPLFGPRPGTPPPLLDLLEVGGITQFPDERDLLDEALDIGPGGLRKPGEVSGEPLPEFLVGFVADQGLPRGRGVDG